MPPLIPIKDFWANQDAVWGHSISDSGKWLSRKEVKGTNIVLRYKAVDGSSSYTLEPSGHFEYSFNDQKSELYVCDVSNCWIIDPLSPHEAWQPLRPSNNHETFIRFPTAFSPYWYFLNHARSWSRPDVYRYSHRGKERTRIAKNTGYVINWQIPENGKVLSRRLLLAKQRVRVEFLIKGQWQRKFVMDSNDTFLVQGNVYGDKPFWALSNRGRDKTAVVQVDPDTFEETVLYQHNRYDVHSTRLSPNDRKPAFALIFDPAPKWIALDTLTPELYHFPRKRPDSIVSLLSESNGGRLLTVNVNTDQMAADSYLIDKTKGETTLLHKNAFHRHDGSRPKTSAIDVIARDGLKLEVYLSLPRKVDGPLPTVLLAHGGPAEREFLQEFQVVPFLANRGYAVLRVNYRGTPGYGKAFLEAGYEELGRKIQDDFADTADWAISNGIADSDNIAIMGPSFGGFITQTAAWRNPELYKAGIAHAGVSDWALDAHRHPNDWAMQLYTGNPKEEVVLETLKEISPVSHAKEFDIPLLLTHGTDDWVVPVVHTKKLVKRLEQAGKSVDVIYFSGEGHALQKWQSKIIYWREVEKFLAKHLGGRAEGWHYIHTAAEIL